jgi:hypothetical protein
MENVGKADFRRETIAIKETKPAPQKPVIKAKKTALPVEKFHKALKNGTPGCARKRPPTPEEITSKRH